MEGLAAGKHNRGRVRPKGSQNCQLGGQAGLVGQVDLGGWVDSLDSLKVGLEVWEGSEGASTEVLEVGHLVGLVVGPEVGCLVDLEEGHLVGLGVDCPVGQKGGYPEVQMVGSYHLGQWEAALGEGGRSDWHRSLG